MKPKLYIIIPKHLKMSPGKMASQVSHATALAVMANPDVAWETVPTFIVEAKDMHALFRIMANVNPKAGKVYPYMDARPTTQGTGAQITAVAVFFESAIVKLDLPLVK